MENLRDNNYGYKLPEAIIEHIKEYEEGEDQERLQALDMILDLCDYIDLNMLSDFSAAEDILEDYFNFLDDRGALLAFILEHK